MPANTQSEPFHTLSRTYSLTLERRVADETEVKFSGMGCVPRGLW